jgi:hypothetical protein
MPAPAPRRSAPASSHRSRRRRSAAGRSRARSRSDPRPGPARALVPPRAPQGRSSAACPPRASPRETARSSAATERSRASGLSPKPAAVPRRSPPRSAAPLSAPCGNHRRQNFDLHSGLKADHKVAPITLIRNQSGGPRRGLPAVGVSTANTNALRSRVAQSSLARRAPAICEDVHPGEGRATALPAPCRGSDWRRRRSRRLRWGRAQLVSSNTLLWPDGENLCGHPDLQRVNLRSKAIRGCPQRIVRKMRIAAGGHRAGVT